MMKKSFVILTVLALSLISASVKLPTAEAATHDLEITEVKWIKTDIVQDPMYYIITVYLNVTQKNSGTEWINSTTNISFGSTLVHQSVLGQYLNYPGITEPTIMGNYVYMSPWGEYVAPINWQPGMTWTEQREIVILVIFTSGWPFAFVGNWYLFSWTSVLDDNSTNNLPWQASTPQDGYIQLVSGVGGFVIPVDKFGLLTPYIGLASTAMIGAVAAVVYVRRAKRREEKQ